MSKKKDKLNFEDTIMSRVKSGEIIMKPKWYFMAGSALLFSGLVVLSVGIIFLINVTAFALRSHNGPFASYRLQIMIENFPWWAPILALSGIILGIWLLKKYDFSYRKNFVLIAMSFVLAVLLAGFLIDSLGLDDYWARRGPMKRFYQRYESSKDLKGHDFIMKENNNRGLRRGN